MSAHFPIVQWEFGQLTMSPTYFEDKTEVKVYQLRKIKALFMDFEMIVFFQLLPKSSFLWSSTTSALSHCELDGSSDM